MQKWYVTGGCGFIGSSLIEMLGRDGGEEHSFRVFDNFTVGRPADIVARLGAVLDVRQRSVTEVAGNAVWEPGVTVVQGELADAEALKSSMTGAEIVVHLAANTGVPKSVEDPVKDALANVMGTVNVLEAARANAVGRVVSASSGAPLGVQEPPIHEEMAARPMSPYGASKLASEGYCSAYYHSYGVEGVSLRFSNVYGPGSGHKSSVVAKFIRQALDGEQLEIYGDGSQTRDFIYIDDLTKAIQLAATVPGLGGETFQIASNSETTLTELVERLSGVFAQAGLEFPTPVNGERRTGDMLRNYSDTTKANTVLGWQPSVGFDDGLQRTLEYFTSNR